MPASMPGGSRTLADLRRFPGHRLADYRASHLPRCFGHALGTSGLSDRERCFWQPGRHPEALSAPAFYRQELDYLHANPCRKGLVRSSDQRRFSSAAYWLSEGREGSEYPDGGGLVNMPLNARAGR